MVIRHNSTWSWDSLSLPKTQRKSAKSTPKRNPRKGCRGIAKVTNKIQLHSPFVRSWSWIVGEETSPPEDLKRRRRRSEKDKFRFVSNQFFHNNDHKEIFREFPKKFLKLLAKESNAKKAQLAWPPFRKEAPPEEDPPRKERTAE